MKKQYFMLDEEGRSSIQQWLVDRRKDFRAAHSKKKEGLKQHCGPDGNLVDQFMRSGCVNIVMKSLHFDADKDFFKLVVNFGSADPNIVGEFPWVDPDLLATWIYVDPEADDDNPLTGVINPWFDDWIFRMKRVASKITADLLLLFVNPNPKILFQSLRHHYGFSRIQVHNFPLIVQGFQAKKHNAHISVLNMRRR